MGRCFFAALITQDAYHDVPKLPKQQLWEFVMTHSNYEAIIERARSGLELVLHNAHLGALPANFDAIWYRHYLNSRKDLQDHIKATICQMYGYVFYDKEEEKQELAP